MIVSSAQTIRLADGSDHPTGYRAKEVREPYETFTGAGLEVMIATIDGKVPQPDPWGLEPFFHYPQVDEDFMFSVLRRFAYHSDRVRVTFTHFAELNLVAVRRVYLALLDTGMEPAQARTAVESAAHRAWRGNSDFIEAMSDSEVASMRLPAERARAIRDEVWQASRARSESAAEVLASLPGLRHPGNLADLTDLEILDFGGVFLPGGHGRWSISPATPRSAACCG
jgi:putative intracellular protease/amidase